MTEPGRSAELELQGVSKSFDGVCALNCVDAEFRPGTVTCVVGPNGAGKTTLLAVSSGFVRADAGQIRYGDQTITRLRPNQIARMGIGRLFQDVRLFRRLSTLENVTVADQRSRGEHPLAAAVWPLIGGRHERENILRARDHLDFVGLADRADKPAKWLSFGQQKLLAISRLLNCGAQCMLLDEPTAGLSPNMVAQVVSTIRALANKNRTIVVVEHNLTVVRALCDWAYIMDDGNITARVRADEIAQRLGRNASGIAASESPPSQPRE